MYWINFKTIILFGATFLAQHGIKRIILFHNSPHRFSVILSGKTSTIIFSGNQSKSVCGIFHHVIFHQRWIMKVENSIINEMCIMTCSLNFKLKNVHFIFEIEFKNRRWNGSGLKMSFAAGNNKHVTSSRFNTILNLCNAILDCDIILVFHCPKNLNEAFYSIKDSD